MGIQRELENIGKFGCYLLCMMYNAKIPMESVIKVYDKLVKEGWIDEECFIKNPATIMGYFITNTRWNVVKGEKIDKEADHIVARYHNKRTGLYHFVVVDKEGNVVFDPLGNSTTVKEGYPESYRLFYKRG